jgi:hypothetical protein
MVMREKESVMAFCAVAGAIMLIGVMVLASSRAQAVPLARSSGLKTAIRQATVTQEARYTCRGPHGRRCSYVSRPEQTARYERPYTYGIDPNSAIYHYWASPANN